MTSITLAPGSGLRTAVTRFHAVCLFIITIASTISATLGWKGRGPFDVLAEQPMGYAGLYQAYFLMFLLALVSLIGATRWPSRLWNAALLVAHLAPLSIIVIANDVLASTDMEGVVYTVAFAIHVPFVLLETFALLWKAPFVRSSAAVRAATSS